MAVRSSSVNLIKYAWAAAILVHFVLFMNYCNARAVICIDFGNDMKVAMLKTGMPMSIVLNTESKRITEAIIAILNKEVVVESPASYLLHKFPENVYPHLRFLMGRTVNDPIFSEYQRHHPFTPLKEDLSRKGALAMKNPEFETLFPIEELVAYMFRHLKDMAEKTAGEPISGAVIVVPPCYDQSARNAILDAAEIADIRVLDIMNDSAAAAYYYLISMPLSDSTPKHFMFADFGSDVTTAYMASFCSKHALDAAGNSAVMPHVEITSVESSSKIGSFDLDALMVEHIISKFEAAFPDLSKKGPGIRSSNKTLVRIRNEVINAKHTLTVNLQYELSFPSLFQDIDFKCTITRLELEGLATDLIKAYSDILKRTLDKSLLEKEDIRLVSLGGASRPPFVQEKVFKAFTGRDNIMMNINPTEAMALGGCFHAADLSGLFKVKEIRIVDRSFGASYITEDNKTFTSLFPSGSILDNRKYITMKKSKDFDFSLHLENPSTEEKLPLAKIYVKNVAQALSSINETVSSEPRVKVTARLSSYGVKVESACVVYNYYENATVPVSSLGTNDTLAANSTEPLEFKTLTLNRTKTIDLIVEEKLEFPRMTKEHKQLCIERGRELYLNYMKRKFKEEACNAVESYAYQIRNQLTDSSFTKFMSPQTNESVSKALGDIIAKLEGTDTLTAEQYKENYNILFKLMEPIDLCRENYQKLPGEMLSLTNSMDRASKFISKARNIASEEVAELDLGNLEKLVDETTTWLREKSNQQQSLPLYEPPVLLVGDITKKKDQINAETAKLSNKYYSKKEKVQPEPKSTKDKQGNTGQDWAEKLSPEMRAQLKKMMEEQQRHNDTYAKSNAPTPMNETASAPEAEKMVPTNDTEGIVPEKTVDAAEREHLEL